MATLFDPSASSAAIRSRPCQFRASPSTVLGRNLRRGRRQRPWTVSELRVLRARVRAGVVCAVLSGTTKGSPSEVMNLGRTSLRVSKLGIGTLQWGDPGSGYGKQYGEEQLGNAFDALIEGGINFFDTAEVYGYQGIKSGTSSEQLLGKYVRRQSGLGGDRLSPVIASKFFPLPWTNLLVGGGFRLGRKSVLAALKESLNRIGQEQIDLYQIHFPFPTLSSSALMESLKEAVEEGLTKAVGVANYSKDQMEEADDILSKYGIPLASNQVQFSVLYQKPVEEGLLQAAQDRGICVIAYSPLASGLLSAKSLSRTDSKSKQVRPLLELLSSVGADHGGKSISQVALNYVISKGALPIAGVKTAEQAKAHVETLGWRLTNDEVAAMERKGG